MRVAIEIALSDEAIKITFRVRSAGRTFTNHSAGRREEIGKETGHYETEGGSLVKALRRERD